MTQLAGYRQHSLSIPPTAGLQDTSFLDKNLTQHLHIAVGAQWRLQCLHVGITDFSECPETAALDVIAAYDFAFQTPQTFDTSYQRGVSEHTLINLT